MNRFASDFEDRANRWNFEMTRDELLLLTPTIERQSSIEEYDCPFDEAELERRSKSVGNTYTTEEVLAYLEKLDVSN